LLQDYFDEFFKGSSASDKGTLCHLKNIFNYRQVKSDISDNFNHACEPMCVATDGYIYLLTMQLLGTTEENERPTSAPEGVENSTFDTKALYLNEVSTMVVDKLWHYLDTACKTSHLQEHYRPLLQYIAGDTIRPHII
jgi:hypothetical protein